MKDDVDALYALPLAEFTAARDALVQTLKKAGRTGDADRVKALPKPSVSAWAANQLFWKHREVFDRLLYAGRKFREAQASQLAGKAADKGAGEARRKAASDLSRLAAAVLSDAGHSASPETMRRIAMTLEALSAYAGLPGAPSYGRLSADMDPPGFDAMAALMAGGIPRLKSAAPARSREKTVGSKDARRQAERELKSARTKAQAMVVSLKKAHAEANLAERQKRETEKRFHKAEAALHKARERAHRAEQRVEQTMKEAEIAAQAVEGASAQLQKVAREGNGDGTSKGLRH